MSNLLVPAERGSVSCPVQHSAAEEKLMNPIVFALRHPYTIMVASSPWSWAAVLALFRMSDIFPSLNLRSCMWPPSAAFDPGQMERP